MSATQFAFAFDHEPARVLLVRRLLFKKPILPAKAATDLTIVAIYDPDCAPALERADGKRCSFGLTIWEAKVRRAAFTGLFSTRARFDLSDFGPASIMLGVADIDRLFWY